MALPKEVRMMNQPCFSILYKRCGLQREGRRGDGRGGREGEREGISYFYDLCFELVSLFLFFNMCLS